jgi:hypothetical protein
MCINFFLKIIKKNTNLINFTGLNKSKVCLFIYKEITTLIIQEKSKKTCHF